MLRLAVIGSRTFNDYEWMCEVLSKYTIDVVVSGGAAGADSLAARYANDNGITLVEYIPDWKTQGKKAGFIRNTEIILNCDRVVAFWDFKSNGTRDSIKKAELYERPIEIVNINNYQPGLKFHE